MEWVSIGVGLLVGWLASNIYNFFEIKRILSLRDCDKCEYYLESREAKEEGKHDMP